MTWKVKKIEDVKVKDAVMIEGLPGIGNVGKVAVDFLIDELKATKIYELSSYTLPHSVFINEQDLVELPKIEIYHKKLKEKDFLFLSGDVQPGDEVSCYEFSENVIEICKENNCKDIITTGGIGLMEIPKKPKLYCTGNSKEAVDKYKDRSLNTKLYGIVGPIVGVSGLLLGMADESTRAIAILAETYGHPMYLGVSGAKEILKTLDKRFSFKIDLTKLDKEIKEMETEMMKRTDDLMNVSKQSAEQKLKSKIGDVNYIG